MGKIFNTNTWSAPLQLIDCWLPLPAQRPVRPSASSAASIALQRFTRAGWLRQAAPSAPPVQVRPAVATHHGGAPTCRVRVLRQTDIHRAKTRDMRLVISGRIADVCAELDRLAALEQASSVRSA